MLALMVALWKACEKRQKVSSAGFECNYRYYEDIDYKPSHLPAGESNVIIRSFMAHHQGMGLLALANLLKNNIMQQRFISCPIAKAFELLLPERIPRSTTPNVITDDSKFAI